MRFLIQKRLSFVLLCLLSMVAVVGAQVDCSHYKGTEDQKALCSYWRIGETRNATLWVVDDGKDLIRKNALPNVDFFVYIPKAGSDAVDVFYKQDGEATPIENMAAVNSGADSVCEFSVTGLYPINNVEIGPAITKDDDPIIVRIYNFYAPKLEYCLDADCKKKVDDASKIKLKAGDSLKVYVQAIVPIGPAQGRLDSALQREFVISASSEAKNIRFLTTSRIPLDSAFAIGSKKKFIGYQGWLNGGKAEFMLTSPKPLTEDSPFSINMFQDERADGKMDYIVKEPFPGRIEFSSPDLPTLDSAFVYDANGDGVGDSIVAYLNGRYETVEKFEYNWPNGDDYSTFGGEWRSVDDHLELKGVKASEPKGEAEGNLKAVVTCANVEKPVKLQTELEDRVGPVIRAASIIEGGDDQDTLVLRFSKDIDESWNEGEGFVVNDVPVALEAIEKKGDVWTFVVDAGKVEVEDYIRIATSCSKKACPDGLVQAADGNKTGKNNPVMVESAGRIYAADENNAFFDRDGDGRMDSASVAFKQPLTRDMLKQMKFKYYWLDQNGDLLEMTPSAKDLTLSEDGTIVGFALDADEYEIKKNLTSIDKSYAAKDEEYGYVTVTYAEKVDGKMKDREIRLSMNDRISPVITGTFLNPESYQKMEADVLTLNFSEPIDYEQLNLEDLERSLTFYVDGSEKKLEFEQASWSEDATTATIRLETGVKLFERMNPADSVSLSKNFKGFKDRSGNGASPYTPTVLVEGDPRVVMQNYSVASRDAYREEDSTTFYVGSPDDFSNASIESSLGILMDVGFATILEKESRGASKLDSSKIGLKWELQVFTSMGAYVAGRSGHAMCSDDVFDGNCFDHSNLYLRWNMRSDAGRRAGIGVYVARFIVHVYGAKETFDVERLYKWGITGSRKVSR